jgi:acetyltransferase-like isoleucine patch superfamily enzyme
MDLIKKIIKNLLTIYKKYKLRKQYIFIGKNVSFKNTKFSIYNKISRDTQVNNSLLGSFSYIGWNSIFNNVNIGSFCSIAPYTEVIYSKHPLDLVSTHPLFYSTKKQSGISFLKKNLIEEFTYVNSTKKSLIIKNDVWIGYGAKLIEGITINNGAVVLAGSIVTRDVEPYSIVGGIPAKHIKYRFDDNTKKTLLLLKWWNRDIDWIKNNMNRFLNVNEFIKEVEIEDEKNY